MSSLAGLITQCAVPDAFIILYLVARVSGDYNDDGFPYLYNNL